MNYCIFLFHKTGGGKTIVDSDLNAFYNRCNAICNKFQGNYLLATLPYTVDKSKIYDCLNTSISLEIIETWSTELYNLYFNIES